jgi:hypothetical protein
MLFDDVVDHEIPQSRSAVFHRGEQAPCRRLGTRDSSIHDHFSIRLIRPASF